MKKQISFLLSLFAVILLATACHSEKVNYEIKQEGQLNLSSLLLTPNTDPLVTESRVAAELNDYIVEVYTEAGELVSSWKYAEMTEVYTLKTGKYKIVAHAPVTEGAAFDTPYCEGESKVFEITQDNLTDVGEVACTLHNVKVTINYADNLKPLLGDDAKVTVKIGSESLEYGKDETRSGFFHCTETNTVDVIFSGTVDGVAENVTKSYTGVALGTELIVTYNLIGQIKGEQEKNINISVKFAGLDTMQNINETYEIKLETPYVAEENETQKLSIDEERECVETLVADAKSERLLNGQDANTITDTDIENRLNARTNENYANMQLEMEEANRFSITFINTNHQFIIDNTGKIIEEPTRRRGKYRRNCNNI